MGGYNGILLALERLTHNRFSLGKSVDQLLETPAGYFLKILLAQGLFVFGLTIFRSQNLDDNWYCIQKFIFLDFIFTSIEIVVIAIIILCTVTFFLLLFNKKFSDMIIRILQIDWIPAVTGLKLSYWFIYLVIIIILLFMFSPSSSPAFFYFQF
jgi:hypothetical protein